MKTKSLSLISMLGLAAFAVPLSLSAQGPAPRPPGPLGDRIEVPAPPPPVARPGLDGAIPQPPPPPDVDRPRPPSPEAVRPPGLGVPPPPAPGRERPLPPGPPDAAEISQISGVVTIYLVNPDGEADGLLLKDGTQLHFPPHMSADLARVIKPGASISAEGRLESPRAFHAFTITDETSRTTVVESRPSAPPVDPVQIGSERKPLQADGKITRLLTAPRGETDGAVLDSGTILRFRPEAAERIVKLLASGQPIRARGFGTENALGRCLEITEIGEVGQPAVRVPAPEAATIAPPPPPVAAPERSALPRR